MTFQDIVFVVFSVIMLLSGLRVVTAKNPVHAALFLVLTFVSASALWLLIEAEFLGIGLVLIYVGAVMVLFLFVVMMLNVDVEVLRHGFWKNLPLACVVAAIMVSELILLIKARGADVASTVDVMHTASNSKLLGKLLYSEFIYPFEIAAIILLVALVAAVGLTFRKRKDSKYVDPGKQSKASSKDRIKLVSMSAEKFVVVEEPAAEQTDVQQ
ncbi:NADH-quinone oxidoreductase subunit J [Leeia sp. TBRC 13508]|uniref:NADH-quinone oxidoreductase subunit J n=1 Tax=Leeia speluncae TaxID=2884804 RepID=A0ABS8D3N8_9NEIS|nr:NADH-quinone oxidoreductase subunit J [Leeia speluncae]MCB6182283.1 NADH-quinone oxidoreductase subunit J [Leeia speluncae]